MQDTYEATLNVHAAPLTFAPYSLSAATGHVTDQQLDTSPLYPLYGGEVKVRAAVNFGASTYGIYELVHVNPDPEDRSTSIKDRCWCNCQNRSRSSSRFRSP